MGLVIIDPNFGCFGSFHGLPPSVKGSEIWAKHPRQAYDIQMLNAHSTSSLTLLEAGKVSQQFYPMKN
jgi:predicted amino acid racemase